MKLSSFANAKYTGLREQVVKMREDLERLGSQGSHDDFYKMGLRHAIERIDMILKTNPASH
jgi:hypothetical protein